MHHVGAKQDAHSTRAKAAKADEPDVCHQSPKAFSHYSQVPYQDGEQHTSPTGQQVPCMGVDCGL